jgi:hypothetical protein
VAGCHWKVLAEKDTVVHSDLHFSKSVVEKTAGVQGSRWQPTALKKKPQLLARLATVDMRGRESLE